MKRKTLLSVSKWLNREMALTHTSRHLIIIMYNFLFVAVEWDTIIT